MLVTNHRQRTSLFSVQEAGGAGEKQSDSSKGTEDIMLTTLTTFQNKIQNIKKLPVDLIDFYFVKRFGDPATQGQGNSCED